MESRERAVLVLVMVKAGDTFKSKEAGKGLKECKGKAAVGIVRCRTSIGVEGADIGSIARLLIGWGSMGGLFAEELVPSVMRC